MTADQGERTGTDAARSAWTEPATEQVVPGVWRIPLPLPNDALRAVNVYAVQDGDGLTFVDGGWALDAARQALVGGLAGIGAKLSDIRRFLVTHVHRDHYTNALSVRREFGSRVLLGLGEKPSLDQVTATTPRLPRQFDRLDRHGAAQLARALRERAAHLHEEGQGYEPPDEWITDGQRFLVGDRNLDAISTPGHTRGHVVFVDRAAGVMFAGDHVLPHITPSVGFEPAPPPLALRDYLASLRLVRSMPDMLLLPAHGPAGDRVHARVDALLAHHAARLDDMAEKLRAGWRTAYEVALRVGWTRRNRSFGELDLVNQMLAVFETALHLDLLTAQGIVVKRETDRVVEYGLRDTSTPV